ncbi:SHOCT domain-containing protein [Fructilactobacillus cliffordii]|uniref:SHOCT domain-containing protein n=1 Tax=Fructilactobacillus cliffordii TaxID=2940299 RepID=UPI002093BEE5|nr:SHOCT domain-containing protein [Fructilactobacillus cliffordii]USS86452.1 SHOCT domain-containing protein [Fructilactobacillus cliffordii]
MQKLDSSANYVKFMPPFYFKVVIVGVICAFISLFVAPLWILTVLLLLFPFYAPLLTGKYYMEPIGNKPNYVVISRDQFKEYKKNHNLSDNLNLKKDYDAKLANALKNGSIFLIRPTDSDFEKWGFNENGNPNLNLSIELHNNDHVLTFPQSNSKKSFYLESIDFTPNIETSMAIKGKTGSSLIGGALFGGVGAVVGSSGKRKIETTKTEKDSVAYMHLISTDLKNEENFAVNAKQQNVNLLQGKLTVSQTFLQNKFQGMSQDDQKTITKQTVESNVDTSTMDAADKIAKYKSLLDQGIITQDEFNTKKKQLLNI